MGHRYSFLGPVGGVYIGTTQHWCIFFRTWASQGCLGLVVLAFGNAVNDGGTHSRGV